MWVCDHCNRLRQATRICRDDPSMATFSMCYGMVNLRTVMLPAIGDRACNQSHATGEHLSETLGMSIFLNWIWLMNG